MLSFSTLHITTHRIYIFKLKEIGSETQSQNQHNKASKNTKNIKAKTYGCGLNNLP